MLYGQRTISREMSLVPRVSLCDRTRQKRIKVPSTFLFCFVFLTRFGSINSIGRPMFEERESRSLRAPSVEHTKEFRPPSPAGCDMDLPFHFLHTAFCSLAGRRVKEEEEVGIYITD